MKIGIIGTGSIGGTLAEKLSAAGHEVKVNNTKDMPELKKVAADLGAEAASIEDVVKDVDVIILSIPFKVVENLPEDLLQDVPEEVIILDTTNYYPFRDGEIAELKNKPESVFVSEKLGRRVTKAFNNLLAYTLKHNGKSAGEEGRIAMAVAGDNEAHKKIASDLADKIGFDTVDAGDLSESWRQQPGTPAYCTELNATELKQALADAVKEDAAHLRDLVMTKFSERTTPPSHDEVVALNRSLFPKNPKEKK